MEKMMSTNLDATTAVRLPDTSQRAVVLLVDDQAMVAEGIRRMLMDAPDIEFHYCSDPRQAINKATEINATLILQDLVMPDIDGMTLMRFFRANPATREIPVIVLSSKEDPKIKSDAFTNGANDYLVKLPDKIELIARIRAHSNSYLTQQQRDEAFKSLHETQKQLEQSNSELRRLSSLDGLTGIANRRRFDEYLEAEWRRCAREGLEMGLVLIDIDYFKFYNDNYGHQQGDDCLKQVAWALNGAMRRPGDLMARYGGEEFVVVLPKTDVQGAMIVAERLRCAIETLNLEHSFSKCCDHVTISLGVASFKAQGDLPAAELIGAADKALYAAKAGGRNRVSSATS
jgi:two-component system chemotaxis family response regulator WspR